MGRDLIPVGCRIVCLPEVSDTQHLTWNLKGSERTVEPLLDKENTSLKPRGTRPNTGFLDHVEVPESTNGTPSGTRLSLYL